MNELKKQLCATKLKVRGREKPSVKGKAGEEETLQDDKHGVDSKHSDEEDKKCVSKVGSSSSIYMTLCFKALIAQFVF